MLWPPSHVFLARAQAYIFDIRLLIFLYKPLYVHVFLYYFLHRHSFSYVFLAFLTSNIFGCPVSFRACDLYLHRAVQLQKAYKKMQFRHSKVRTHITLKVRYSLQYIFFIFFWFFAIFCFRCFRCFCLQSRSGRGQKSFRGLLGCILAKFHPNLTTVDRKTSKTKLSKKWIQRLF